MSRTPKKNSKPLKRINPTKVEVLPPRDNSDSRPPVVKSVTHTQSWSGPFLPPNVMKEYDHVVPDGAARLFKIFEDETKHRREMESSSLRYQGRDLIFGKLMALVFAFGVLGVVLFAIEKNAPWIAAILGAGMLGTIIFGFLRIFGDNAPRGSGDKPTNSKNN